MKQTSYTSIAGLRRSLRQLPREATVELRDESVEIARGIATEAQTSAAGLGGVATLVAPSIRATRDRIPVVSMGGSTKLPERADGVTRQGGRQTIGDVIWGAEFGGQHRPGRPGTMQFRPHAGKLGYFLWPTVRARSGETQQQYSAALKRAMDKIP